MLRSRPIQGLILSLSLLALPAIARSQDAVHRFRVVMEEGVPVAVTSGGPKFAGELFRYEKVLTLHQDPEDLDSLIGAAVGFAAIPDGRSVVVDNQFSGGGYVSARLVIFDSDGEYVRAMGGVGSGPGEFQSMILEYVRGDTVAVFDQRSRRLTLYGTDGTLVDVIPVPALAAPTGRAFYAASGGRLVAGRPFPVNSGRGSAGFSLLERDGSVVATVDTAPLDHAVMVDEGGRAFPRLPPYPAVAAYRVLPDAVVLSPGDRPVLETYSFQGVLERRIRIEDLPLRVTHAEIQRFDEYWEDLIVGSPEEQRPMLRDARQRFRQAMPEILPAWTFIYRDDAGYWWLRVQDRPDLWEGGTPAHSFRVISPAGEYLGITEPPPTFLRSTGLWNDWPISVAKELSVNNIYELFRGLIA